MSSKKNTTLILTLSFVGALIISFIVMQQLFLQHSLAPVSEDKVILAFATNITYKSYDENGHQQSNIRATSFEHYQKDAQSLFEYPHGLIYTKERIPWQIRANKGKAFNTADRIDLSGNVIMHQLPYPSRPETTIKTEAVSIYPATEIAETDQPVLIQQLGNQVEGVGMKADMGKGIIDILSQSKGYYHSDNT
jgi:lipopolysaccharide export system protein LptC